MYTYAALAKTKLKSLVNEKLLYILTNVVFFFVFLSIVCKTFLLIGFVVSYDHSLRALINSYKEVPSPTLYLAFILALLSFAFLFKGRGHLWYLVGLNLFLSILYLVDLWYYRGYGNLLTIHLATHTMTWKDLSEKIVPMINKKDIVFILDAVVLLVVCFLYKEVYKKMCRSIVLFVLTLAMSVGYISYEHYMVDVTKRINTYYLFSVLWAPYETIKNLSPVGYHVFDAYIYWRDCRHSVLSLTEKEEIRKWYEDKKETLPDNKYKGIFKGKNLIFIQVESLENFVLQQKINGIEVTPTMNSLLKNSLYFSNYMEQVNNGVSSDGDLLVNTSIYPVRKGSTFMRYPYNTYNSLPRLMEKQGYSTLAVKPDSPVGWNWVQALYGLGFQKCMDVSSFNVDERIILGLSDESFLRQVLPVIQKQKQPFYTFMVTLTSHGPFDLPQKYRELGLKEAVDKTTMGGYLESVHYTDKHIGKFIEGLKRNGMLQNTVIAISGDHCGIHKYNYKDQPRMEDSENWWFGNEKRIPFIIYSEGLQGEEFKVYGGQIDALPTLAYLMGIDEKEIAGTAMGRNLLKTRKDFAVLSDGSCSGSFAEANEKENAVRGLELADKIIRSDFFKTAAN